MHSTTLFLLSFLAACGDSSEPSPSPSVESRTEAPLALGTASVAVNSTVEAPLPGADVQRRIDKGEGLIVEILTQGDGPVVELGKEVTLEYTISYVPKPVDPAKEAEAKKEGAKSGKDKEPKSGPSSRKRESPGTKADDKKSDEKKGDDKKPADKKSDEPKSKDEVKPSEVKTTGAGHEGDAKTEEPKHEEPKVHESKPDEGKSDEPKTPEKSTEKSTEKPAEKPADKPAETAPTAPPEPPKPVVIASTKGLTTPCVVKLGSSSAPMLWPGFARGIEGLKVGTRARITVPPELACGKSGNASAGVPPETPLQIEVFVRGAR